MTLNAKLQKIGTLDLSDTNTTKGGHMQDNAISVCPSHEILDIVKLFFCERFDLHICRSIRCQNFS